MLTLFPRLLLSSLFLVLLTTAGAAQTDTRLKAAVQEAREGRSDSARAVVTRLLAATPASDTLYPQLVYTLGIIENDAGQMRRRLQQVAVEYPTSPWAADALLRLAQLDYALRHLDAAAQNLERLAVGFPQTPLWPHAAYWAGRVYFDLNRASDACRWLTEGMARAGDDVEAKTQLAYLQQRCQHPSPTPVAADSTPKPPPPPAPTLGPRFRVQVAAVASAAAAEAAAQKAASLGYPAVTVKDGGLYKVRVGEFDTRDRAYLAVAELKQAFGGSPFVVAN